MQQARITQQELASLIGTSQPAISMYLKGRIPPADVLYKIAQIGQTTVEWLLTGDVYSEKAIIREPQVDYGYSQSLLELWSHLSPANQKIILSLIRKLTENR
jgi:transcriptional regulator with XRE-family HTH domain